MATTYVESYCESTVRQAQQSLASMLDMADVAVSRLDQQSLDQLAAHRASATDVKRQLLLHMPRLGNPNGAQIGTWIDEAKRLSLIICEDREQLSRHVKLLDVAGHSLDDFTFRECDISEAHHIVRYGHYLRSTRPGAKAYGLFSKRWPSRSPAALALISEFDLNEYDGMLPEGGSHLARVVSRIIALRDVPRNTISFLLGSVYNALRRTTDATTLFTYINRNLGFTGASVKSSGWWLFAQEKMPYLLYEGGEYRTEREMLRQYGTCDFHELRRQYGERIERSKVELCPYDLYAFSLYRNEEFRVSPPPPLLVAHKPIGR